MSKNDVGCVTCAFLLILVVYGFAGWVEHLPYEITEKGHAHVIEGLELPARIALGPHR